VAVLLELRQRSSALPTVQLTRRLALRSMVRIVSLAATFGCSPKPSTSEPTIMSREAPADGVVLIPLGTGKGATSVYNGEPSSSFVVQAGGKCRLLVDAGLGVVRQCLKHCGSVPEAIYISHNHTDHAGDLPVLLIVERNAGRKLTVISAPEVESRLRQHRLHELYSTGRSADDIANWTPAPEGEVVRVDDEFTLVTHLGRHSETSYGFVLFHAGTPILGFSADSGKDPALYDKLALAPTLVLDARSTSSIEHASFSELAALKHQYPNKRVFVTGYGTQEEAPRAGLEALRIGEPVFLTAGK
jgi:glyoxylase-like metal-dependent hydrolase (beta-lactamase superfamily II)